MIEEDFAGILDFHMRNSYVGDKRLADMVNNEFGDICRIGRSTIQKWRTRTVLRIRDWRQVAAIANILKLNKAEAEQLLKKGGFPELMVIWKTAEASEKKLLVQWIARPKYIPLQLPERSSFFTDRNIELGQVLEQLQPGQIVTLCGPGGMGKSALAAEAVWQIAPNINIPPARFPDGIIYFNFEDQPQSDMALEHFALSYDVEPRPNPKLAAQRALSGKQALLVLDSAEKANDLPTVLQVRGACGVLITTRSRASAPANFQELRPLPHNEAVNLLRQWGGAQINDELTANQICDLIGNLPLAVRLVGRYLLQKREPAEQFLQLLRQTPLVALNQGDRTDESVPLLLKQSLSQVSRAAQDILALAGFLSVTPFTIEMVEEAMVLAKGQVKNAIDELIDFGLLDRADKRIQVSHALIHTYARKHLIVAEKVIGGVYNYYISLASTLNQLGPAGYRSLDAERQHYVALIHQMSGRKEWQNVINLVLAIESYLDMQGFWTERAVVINAGLHAAQKLGQPENEADFWGKLGYIQHVLGNYEEAIKLFTKTLTIVNKLEVKGLQSEYLGNIGNVFLETGKFREAAASYEEALLVARESGDLISEARQLNRLGLAHRELGMFDEAVDYHSQSIDISQSIGHWRLLASATGNLGLAYRKMGKLEDSVKCHTKALTIVQEIGYRQGEAEHSGNLGSSYERLKQYDEAIKYHEHSIQISKEIGYRRAEANQVGNLGVVYHKLGEHEKAIQLMEESLAISREIGTRRTEGNLLSDLADVFIDQGEVEKAVKYLQDSLLILEEINSANITRVRSRLEQLITSN